MTVEAALNLLTRLAADVSMPLAGHAQSQQAAQVLAQFIENVKTMAEDEEEQEEE